MDHPSFPGDQAFALLTVPAPHAPDRTPGHLDLDLVAVAEVVGSGVDRSDRQQQAAQCEDEADHAAQSFHDRRWKAGFPLRPRSPRRQEVVVRVHGAPRYLCAPDTPVPLELSTLPVRRGAVGPGPGGGAEPSHAVSELSGPPVLPCPATARRRCTAAPPRTRRSPPRRAVRRSAGTPGRPPDRPRRPRASGRPAPAWP